MVNKYRNKFNQKYLVNISNTIIVIVILAGFLAVEYGMARFYNQNAREQAQNDVILTGFDVSSQITNISVEQRVASLMISNDIFLKEWALTETDDPEDNENIQQIYDYLKAYQISMGYDTVFFVSAKTGNYYYQDGFNKKISEEDEFDSWYYNFVDLNKEYDIQVDRDETLEYSVSLFVNCRVEDENGNLIGVAGTAHVIDDMNTAVSTYKDTLGVEVYVINTGNAVNSFTGSDEFYKSSEDAAEILGVSEDFLTKKDSNAYDYKWMDDLNCLTIQYNEEMGWNIVVVQNISDTLNEYRHQMLIGALFLLLVLVIFISGSTFLLTKINTMSREAENADDLTGLCNNRLFREKYNKELRKRRQKGMSLFMVDIDDFKQFNDTMGHLYGNGVIRLVSSELENAFEDVGIIGRWGGDEFVGISFMGVEKTASVLRDVQVNIENKNLEMTVGISAGVTLVKGNEKIDSAVDRADKGLYESKKNGKGSVVIV
ncbi:MAG: sensor domain-containing diguanylate cyclase [Butyrivibrio sp.]|nr:sensor domain-containing diguanylate cyclase [Butyrivibrio sp.]